MNVLLPSCLKCSLSYYISLYESDKVDIHNHTHNIRHSKQSHTGTHTHTHTQRHRQTHKQEHTHRQTQTHNNMHVHKEGLSCQSSESTGDRNAEATLAHPCPVPGCGQCLGKRPAQSLVPCGVYFLILTH